MSQSVAEEAESHEGERCFFELVTAQLTTPLATSPTHNGRGSIAGGVQLLSVIVAYWAATQSDSASLPDRIFATHSIESQSTKCKKSAREPYGRSQTGTATPVAAERSTAVATAARRCTLHTIDLKH